MTMPIETTLLGEGALKFSREISQATTMSALSQVFAEGVAKVGMTASACGMVTGPRALTSNPFYFVNWPQDWLKLYIENGYASKDPLPRWALVSGMLLKWTALISSLPRGDPGHEVYAAARAWGFSEGLAVPLRSQTGALGLVTTGGNRAALNADEESFVITISNAVFHKAEQLEPLALSPRFQAFSRRQLECLALLHHGFTDKEDCAIPIDHDRDRKIASGNCTFKGWRPIANPPGRLDGGLFYGLKLSVRGFKQLACFQPFPKWVLAGRAGVEGTASSWIVHLGIEDRLARPSIIGVRRKGLGGYRAISSSRPSKRLLVESLCALLLCLERITTTQWRVYVTLTQRAKSISMQSCIFVMKPPLDFSLRPTRCVSSDGCIAGEQRSRLDFPVNERAAPSCFKRRAA